MRNILRQAVKYNPPKKRFPTSVIIELQNTKNRRKDTFRENRFSENYQQDRTCKNIQRVRKNTLRFSSVCSLPLAGSIKVLYCIKIYYLLFFYTKMKDSCCTEFWKCLNWRLSPKLYQQLLEFNFGRLLSHNCEFCCFLQSKNGSLATKAKLGKQALACDQYSLI